MAQTTTAHRVFVLTSEKELDTGMLRCSVAGVRGVRDAGHDGAATGAFGGMSAPGS